MSRGRQRDYAQKKSARLVRMWRLTTFFLISRRALCPSTANSAVLLQAFEKYIRVRKDYESQLLYSRRISASQFTFNFNGLSNFDCLFLFRFEKDHIKNLLTLNGWPSSKTRTMRNRYACDAMLSTCVMLRRLASPCRWKELEILFGKHASQLSEIFWESIEHLIEEQGHLIKSSLKKEYIQENISKWSSSISIKSGALTNCIGFIDGTVIGISRPGDSGMQTVAYNGHKRKHALKFQAISTPDGMFLHMYGPLEGRKHDWTLYVRSNVDEQLEECLLNEGLFHCIYGDSGYSAREYLVIPFQGASLSEDQVAFNKAMSKSRITVEWIFKELKLNWTSMDFKRKLRIGESPVGALYVAAALLTNVRNCIYPNPISQYFGCEPPSLEDYMHSRD
eukprot:IDg1768t1